MKDSEPTIPIYLRLKQPVARALKNVATQTNESMNKVVTDLITDSYMPDSTSKEAPHGKINR
jgi:hypothetical protein